MLRNRLILVTLLISLVPLVLLGAFSSQQSRSLLGKSAADTLDSQAGLKGSQIAAYLESVRHDVMALAESQMSRQAMPAFATGFQTFLDQELGEDVGDLVALGAVVDDEPIAEFLGETDGGGDVVVAVAVLIPGQVAVEDRGEGLVREIAVERLALRGCRCALLGVGASVDECLAEDRGHTQAG